MTDSPSCNKNRKNEEQGSEWSDPSFSNLTPVLAINGSMVGLHETRALPELVESRESVERLEKMQLDRHWSE